MFRIAFSVCVRLLPIAWILAVAVPSLLAQFNSSIQGTVVDASGSHIPGARVQIKNTQTGVVNEQKSNGDGIYRFSGVAPGSYLVTAEASGFERTEIRATVTQGQTAGVDVHLAVAQANTQITVTANAAALNPDETRLQTTVDSAALRDLPLQNRNIYSIATLAPGVTGFINSSSFDNFGTGQQLNVSANGHYYTGNTYIIDGVYVVDDILNGAPDLSPNPDSVQEAALQTNAWSVDHGTSSSVVNELTTKSGTNTFHGSSNFIFNNQDLRAGTEFVHNYSPQKRYDIDGVFGGPIIKNRTFFFISTDVKRSNLQSTGLISYEDPAFTAWAKANHPNTLGTKFLTTYLPSKASFTNVLRWANPTYTTSCTTPTAGCNTPYVDQGVNANAPANNGYQYNLRGDQYFHNGSDRLFGEFYRTHNDNDMNQFRPTLGGYSFIDAYLGSVNYQHSFSPSVVNQATFGIFHIRGGDVNNVTPFLPYLSNTISEGANLELTGGPSLFSQFNWQGRDVLSALRGRHTIKLGVEAFRPNETANFNYSARPSYSFQTLTDFAEDNVYQESGVSFDPLTGKFKPQNFGVQNTQIGAFVGDDWKIRENLLLTFGVRWDTFGNPYAYGSPEFTSLSNIYTAPGNLYQQFQNAVLRQHANVFNHREWNNWSPRGAFAWSPTKDKKTTLRGGIGLYRDQISIGQVVDPLRGNPPGLIYPTFGAQQQYPAILSWGSTAAFPYNFAYPNIPASQLNASGGLPGFQPGITGVDPNLVIPKTINYQFAVERQIAGSLVTSLTYSGSHAYDQLSGTDYNRFAGNLVANNGRLTRLNPNFGAMGYVSNLNSVKYNAFIVAARQRIGSLNYQGSFTWSKGLDYGSCNTRQDYNGGVDCPPDQRYYTNNYGPDSFNIKYRGTLSASYIIPVPHAGFLTPLIRGWQVSTIAIFQTGLPWTAENYNPYNASCTGSNVTCGDYNADGYNNDRPNILAGAQTGGWTRQQYLRGVYGPAASAFTAPALGTEGNEGRNSLVNPGLINVDASLIKNFKISIREGFNFQVRGDFFNVLNRVNLTTVDYNLASPTFARSLNTYQPRVIQLGARIDF